MRWAVDQGHTVFVVSWVNPDEKLAEKGFDDYMQEGVYAALDAIEKATGEKRGQRHRLLPGRHAAGHHPGLHGGEARTTRIKAATFFVTMIDFEEAGELGVFIDEEQLRALEDKMKKRGFLEGAEMATTFNMLRANDLIWSFVVNNYLLGKEPFPFDLLYWNDDSTRMPARMHSFYLRRMYQQNELVKPGGIERWARRSTCGRSRCRPTSSRRGRTTSRPGRAPIAPRRSRRPEPLRARRLRPYRRRGEPARGRQVQPLDQREPAARPRCLVPGRDGNRRLLVAGLAPLDHRSARRQRRCRRGSPATASCKPIEDAPGSYVAVMATD